MAEHDPMSTVDPARSTTSRTCWPAEAGPSDALGSSSSPRTCSAPTARSSNFGGGNTSAKGTTIDHAGREIDGHVGQGLGQRPRDDAAGALHRPAARRDPAADRARRDDATRRWSPTSRAASSTRRCRAASIETLLHAFVPAPHVAPHASGRRSTCSPGTADGERLVAECFGDDAAWIPYIRPGFALSKQVGEAVRDNPEPEARRARQARPRRLGRHARRRRTGARSRSINHAAAFVNERTDGDARASAGAQRLRAGERAALLRELLPALRGAVSSERAKVLHGRHVAERVLEFVSSRRRAELVQVGAPCPDHLVHTKRLPLWIPFDPRPTTPTRCANGSRELAERYRDDYRAYFERTATTTTVPADPTRASC